MREEIKCEKIILRKYEMDFAPLLFEAAIESKGGEFSRWMPWCHADYSIDESESFVNKIIKDRENHTGFAFAIFDRETNKYLGDVALNNPNSIHKIFNLGYWVRVSCQKREIASTATRALAQAAFEDLDINRIEILAAVENIPSQKVAEKAGAVREGVLRSGLFIGGRIHDAAIFSFVREDFAD